MRDERNGSDPVRDELLYHIEEHAAELMREGVPQAEALRRARAAFRDLEGTHAALERMTARRAWKASFNAVFADMGGDVRRAVRGLLRRPALALLAVVTLALGIGANTTIFGLLKRWASRAGASSACLRWSMRSLRWRVPHSAFSSSASQPQRSGCSCSLRERTSVC